MDMISFLCQYRRCGIAGLVASLIIVIAEIDVFVRELIQDPFHRLHRKTAAGDIAMLRPVIRADRQERHQVDRRFKDIEAVIRADVMKTIFGFAALNINTEGSAIAVSTALMSVPSYPVLIQPNKDGVMILRFLIERFCLCEERHHVTGDLSVLGQISPL